ncbi:iron ABC transporter permease [Curvibacter sp. CHRR-16]|uniref:FecCD family ABC transporter permease n=1 Tax=Curvibacter sp. CHRR-16 TaxID=2835872 RepID=UPI001BD96382|nr:iron ABC transporter permease [Curvibacter sp. CHRR-16]MBT0569190.1 iron ABC transporter permease [Curvibacter sp. CHRR-16]
MHLQRPFPLVAACAVLGVLTLGLLAVLGTLLGSTALPWQQVLSSLLGNWGHAIGLPAVDMPTQRIIVDLRLPRVLLAGCVGAGLALVGAMLQTATRNDLADPFLFGISSGASAGAVATITLLGDALGIWSLPLAALVGALASASIVLALVGKTAGRGPEKIILAGLASSFLFGALTHFLVFAGDQRAAGSVFFWTLGGLGSARWDNLPLALLGLGLLVGYAYWRRRALDGLLAGDETAHSLGLHPQRLRYEVFAVSSVATACFVALSGVIGFVGLMVPHLARAITGALHTRLLLLCALMGACFLLASDLVSRTLLAPQELPVGIVTGAVGGVFVVVNTLRQR